MFRLIGIMVQNELRIRTRRASTLVTLLLVVIVSWSMVADPASGQSMITVGKSAVQYNSSALAVGSAVLAGILFGLFGFYLVRGRSRDDLIRCHGCAGQSERPVRRERGDLRERRRRAFQRERRACDAA